MTEGVDELIARMLTRYDRVLAQGQALSGSVQTWLAAHPMAVRAEIADDRLSWQLHLDVDKPPLDDWGHAFGEAVHNLRACLNNLAWALANAGGAPKKPKRVQFPIVTHHGDWTSERSRIAELPHAAQVAIERVQPFQRIGGSDGTADSDLLVLLADLSNTDKHRVALAGGRI